MATAVTVESNWEYQRILIPGGQFGLNTYPFLASGHKKINRAEVVTYMISGLVSAPQRFHIRFQNWLSSNELKFFTSGQDQLDQEGIEILANLAPVTLHNYPTPWVIWEGSPIGGGDRSFNVQVDATGAFTDIVLILRFRVIRDHNLGSGQDYIKNLSEWSSLKDKHG